MITDEQTELKMSPFCVVADFLDEAVVGHDEVKHLAGGAHHGRGQGVTEGVGPGSLSQKTHQVPGPCGVPPRRATQCLAQGRVDDVTASLKDSLKTA